MQQTVKTNSDAKSVKYVNKRGYAIYKSALELSQCDKIRKDLTVSPIVIEGYGIPEPPFPIYLESNLKLYLPKHYAIAKLGKPDAITLNNNIYKTSLKFKGELRENQMEPLKLFMDSCNLDGDYTPESLTKFSYGGIISLPCGYGKTVLALKIIAELGVKTLIIVHKEFLMNQWIERINQYLPDAKVGTIQQKRQDVHGKDIVIGMLQSLSMKEYSDYIFEEFGFCIVDECHHLGAEVFSRALPKVNCKYTLGLSATPNRSDGLSRVFEHYLGPYIYILKVKNERVVHVNMVYYKNKNPLYSNIETLPNGKPCMARMTNNITEFNRRNEIILEIISSSVKTHGIHILALSDRLEHLNYLYNQICDRKIGTVGFYVGGMKQTQLKKSEECQIILGTFTMAAEALDIPSLNTLILMTSHGEGAMHTQSCGRILRREHETIVPTIWDICDDFSQYANQAKRRLKHYKRENYKIFTVNITDKETEPIEDVVKLIHTLELDCKPKQKSKASKKHSITDQEVEMYTSALADDNADY
jgi:superfamily II DNA or RNA helicase